MGSARAALSNAESSPRRRSGVRSRRRQRWISQTCSSIRTRTFKRHIEIIYTARGMGEARAVSREIRSLKWFEIDSMPAEMSLDLQFAIHKALSPPKL